jgi:DMSO reductase anchor subunit
MRESIQKEIYEWMVKATPQREWIESKGLLLWLAFFFSEIGAGIYFVSLFVNFREGLVAGLLITLVLGGLLHMMYLGKPLRFWRIFLKPATSELSRGVWVILVFSILGFVQIALSYSVAYQAIAFSLPFQLVTGLLCILLIMHGFATMNVMRAIPSWNSSMVLPLSIISGIWVGSQFVQSMALVSSGTGYGAQTFENWSILLLLTYIGCILLYIWGTFHSSDTARISIADLVSGSGARVFNSIVLAGIVLPLIITIYMRSFEISLNLILMRLVFVFVGDMLLRYGLMKKAYYTPLI